LVTVGRETCPPQTAPRSAAAATVTRACLTEAGGTRYEIGPPSSWPDQRSWNSALVDSARPEVPMSSRSSPDPSNLARVDGAPRGARTCAPAHTGRVVTMAAGRRASSSLAWLGVPLRLGGCFSCESGTRPLSLRDVAGQRGRMRRMGGHRHPGCWEDGGGQPWIRSRNRRERTGCQGGLHSAPGRQHRLIRGTAA